MTTVPAVVPLLETKRLRLRQLVVMMMAGALEHAPDRQRLRVERMDVAARLVVHAVLNVARAFAGAPMGEADLHVHRRELARMIYRYLLRDPVDVPHDDEVG